MIDPEHVKEIRARGNIVPSSATHYAELLKDPVWRISNHYMILTKPNDMGIRSKIRFKPNDAQCEVMYWNFVLGRTWLNILKARQLGFTTYFQIKGLDKALTEANANVKFVSQTDDVAKSAFSEKAVLAYNSLDRDYLDYLKDEYGTGKGDVNQSQIQFGEGWGLYTYVSVRGGTSSFVHISELGPMSSENMSRAQEVFAGAMETASVNSDVVIESTFKGGQFGIYYENLKKALDMGDKDRPKGQFWFMFFPWFEDKDYRIDDGSQELSPHTVKYFAELEAKLGRTFDRGQKLWYQVKEDRLGHLMLQENPSTPEEAMSAPTEGALYADQMRNLKKEGRYCSIPVDSSRPVYCAWDIGKRDPTAMWIVQFIDGWIHWLWHYQKGGEEPSFFVEKQNECGIHVDYNLLPHDAYQDRAGGSWHTLFKQAGLRGTKRLDKTNDRWVGIHTLQGLLKRSKFNIGTTEKGIDCLEAYRAKMDISNGIMSSQPVHDWTSDTADAARYVAEGIITKKIKDKDIQREVRDDYHRRQGIKANNGFRNADWWK